MRVAMHRTAADYHTSGAWMAVAVAGVVSGIYGLDAARCWHAMGIAEYHGPRSQMMRVIDYTTMLKDGSGWGRWRGSVLQKWPPLALPVRRPPLSAMKIAPISGQIWAQNGCPGNISSSGRFEWAQPAMQAIKSLWQEGPFDIQQIDCIEIETFHESLRLAAPPNQSG